jgi:hypothetical protein
MQCPDCGYALTPFDKECPRCKNLRSQPAHPAPVPARRNVPAPLHDSGDRGNPLVTATFLCLAIAACLLAYGAIRWTNERKPPAATPPPQTVAAPGPAQQQTPNPQAQPAQTAQLQPPTEDLAELQVVDGMVAKYNQLVAKWAPYNTEMQRLETEEAAEDLDLTTLDSDTTLAKLGQRSFDGLIERNGEIYGRKKKTLEAELRLDTEYPGAASAGEEAAHVLDNLKTYELFRKHYREVVRDGYRYYERYQ